MNRRSFLKTVAAAAVLPVAVSSPAPAWAVIRATMWASDADSTITLARCNRLLATNADDVLSLVHRGQLPSIYLDSKQAWTDLSRAISLEPSPCCFYLRGVCFNVVADLRHAVSLLSMSDDIDGEAICSSIPDYYKWQGTEPGEMMYLSLRELGCVEEQDGRSDEAIAAYTNAARFESISPNDLGIWSESSFAVGLFCRSLVAFDRLISDEPRAEIVGRREECWAAIRGRRKTCGQIS